MLRLRNSLHKEFLDDEACAYESPPIFYEYATDGEELDYEGDPKYDEYQVHHGGLEKEVFEA